VPDDLGAALNSLVADAARRYVYAWQSQRDANVAGQLAALVDLDSAFHDLVVLVLGDCPLCDRGTCPLAVVEIIDPRGRI
jgi:hypothetical protein